jgi:hypothetical protein
MQIVNGTFWLQSSMLNSAVRRIPQSNKKQAQIMSAGADLARSSFEPMFAGGQWHKPSNHAVVRTAIALVKSAERRPGDFRPPTSSVVVCRSGKRTWWSQGGVEPPTS